MNRSYLSFFFSLLSSFVQNSIHLELKTQHFYGFAIVKSTRATESYCTHLLLLLLLLVLFVSQTTPWSYRTNEWTKEINIKAFHVHCFLLCVFFTLFHDFWLFFFFFFFTSKYFSIAKVYIHRYIRLVPRKINRIQRKKIPKKRIRIRTRRKTKLNKMIRQTKMMINCVNKGEKCEISRKMSKENAEKWSKLNGVKPIRERKWTKREQRMRNRLNEGKQSAENKVTHQS